MLADGVDRKLTARTGKILIREMDRKSRTINDLDTNHTGQTYSSITM